MTSCEDFLHTSTTHLCNNSGRTGTTIGSMDGNKDNDRHEDKGKDEDRDRGEDRDENRDEDENVYDADGTRVGCLLIQISRQLHRYLCS